MKIERRRRTWIHTHFVTDCLRLPAHRMEEIQRQMAPALRKMGIVFGLHFEAEQGEPGVIIVLECKPLPAVLEYLHLELQRIVEPIPARPRTVALLPIDEPADASAVPSQSELTESRGGSDRAG